MLDLIVLHGEFSLFTVRGNFWYQIYRNRRKKVLCSRLSLITLTKLAMSTHQDRCSAKLDGCYSSKFLRSSVRRSLLEARRTRYEVARAGLVH